MVALLARRADFRLRGDPSAQPRVAVHALVAAGGILAYGPTTLYVNRLMVDQPFTLAFALREIGRSVLGLNLERDTHLAGSIGEWFPITVFLLGLGALAVGVVLTLMSSAGLGILSASFILYFKRGDPINFFLSGLTTFFGNVFFPVEQLPEFLRPVSEYLPITWSLRIIRGSLLQGRPSSDLYNELKWRAILTVVLLPLGVLFSRVAIRRAKKEGTLIQY